VATLGDISAIICAILGILAMAIGGVTAFAGGMSRVPNDGIATVRFGCGLFAVGLLCVVIGGWRLTV
jgi:hypothetical protein